MIDTVSNEHNAVLLTVPGGLRANDRRRMLVHLVAEAAHSLLEQPGVDTSAVTITTHAHEDEIVVTATAPLQKLPPDLG